MPTRRMRTEKRRKFSKWQKTIDCAIWLTFKNRLKNIPYGSTVSKGGYRVDIIDSEHENLNDYYQGIYSHINFEQIKAIRQDKDPLAHWEDIVGAFSVMDGELLRFLIHTDMNLMKFVRYELASRGFDKDHKWVGFDKAEEIWLNNQ